MPFVPNLEFSSDEMRRMADAVMARSIEHIASLGAQRVLGDVNAHRFCRALREPAPEAGCALEPLLDQLFDDYIPRSFNTPAPGCLAFIPGGGVFPAALADFITNTSNRFTGIWQAAPALVQLEANALDWLRDWMGFPETTRGLFTVGGSMATFNALLCARERHLGADIRRGVIYTSDQAHHSVLKAVNGVCMSVLGLLTGLGVTTETTAKWAELDALTTRVLGVGVTAETADTFGLQVLGVGAAVVVTGWVLAKVSGEK